MGTDVQDEVVSSRDSPLNLFNILPSHFFCPKRPVGISMGSALSSSNKVPTGAWWMRASSANNEDSSLINLQCCTPPYTKNLRTVFLFEFISTSLDWISEWVSVQTASHSQHFYVWLAKWIMDKLGLFRSLRWNSSIKTLANIRLCHLGFQWMPKLLPLHSCCTHCKQELRFLQLSVELVFRRLRIINQLTRMPSVPCEIDIFFASGLPDWDVKSFAQVPDGYPRNCYSFAQKQLNRYIQMLSRYWTTRWILYRVHSFHLPIKRRGMFSSFNSIGCTEIAPCVKYRFFAQKITNDGLSIQTSNRFGTVSYSWVSIPKVPPFLYDQLVWNVWYHAAGTAGTRDVCALAATAQSFRDGGNQIQSLWLADEKKRFIRLRLIPKVIDSLLLFLSAPRHPWGVSPTSQSCTNACAVLKWLREYTEEETRTISNSLVEHQLTNCFRSTTQKPAAVV